MVTLYELRYWVGTCGGPGRVAVLPTEHLARLYREHCTSAHTWRVDPVYVPVAGSDLLRQAAAENGRKALTAAQASRAGA